MKWIDELTKAGGEVFEVGGSVRDRLLSRKIKDRDLLITKLPLEGISRVLAPHGKVACVGKSFGILKFYPYTEGSPSPPRLGSGHALPLSLPRQARDTARGRGNIEESVAFDIAIPRKEVSTGAGHRDFKVDYDPNLPVEIDLARRDFTINAMAYNVKTGKLIDPFGGEKDLKGKVLKQVFAEAFIEDPLRLLRAIQFSARFKLKIEPETMESMVKNAHLIKTVSGERIIEELKKLMYAEKPSLGFVTMLSTGILAHLLPQLEATKGIAQAKQEGDDVFTHTMKVLDATRSDTEIDNAGDMELMFAALLHDIGKAKTTRYLPEEDRIVFYGHQIVSARMASKILKNLKSTTIDVDPKIVATLIENHMFETKSFFSDKAIRRFISKVGKDLIFKLLDLRLADNRGGKYPGGIKGVLKLKKRTLDEINRKVPFGPKDLAVNGRDIMELGVKEGPKIGEILGALVETVLDDPELNTREQLIAIIGNILDNSLDAGGQDKNPEGPPSEGKAQVVKKSGD